MMKKGFYITAFIMALMIITSCSPEGTRKDASTKDKKSDVVEMPRYTRKI